MRTIGHWTPRYVKNCCLEIFYRRTHPDYPWLTRSANEILASYLQKSDVGLEFGSGQSTVWFAKRIRHLRSIERNENWYKKVNTMLIENSLDNVELSHIGVDIADKEGGNSSYLKIFDQIESESLDFVLIDGYYRDYCAQRAIRTIRKGGMLIVDNANWFLPSETKSPFSQTYEKGPSGLIWNDFSISVTKWRTIWTSDGVSDTAFFFKPCN